MADPSITVTVDFGQIMNGIATLAGIVVPGWLSYLAFRAAQRSTQASKDNAATLATVTKKVDDVAVVADQTQTNTNGLSERSEVAAHAVGYAKGVADGLAAAQAKLGADALAREQAATTATPTTETGTAS